MDVPRQAPPKRRRWMLASAAGLGLILLMVALARLKPAAPEAERQSLLIDTVKRGPMVFQVRGTGTLVPLNVRWISANADSRVEKILVWPGTAVKADTEILELSNPEAQQAAQDAMWQLRAAEADYTSAKAKLESQLLDLRASVASAKAAYTNAKMTLEANERLSKAGLVASQDLARAQAAAEELTTRYEIERQRMQIDQDSLKAQLASQEARVQQARALYALKQGLVDGLKVRAGMDGVLQQLPVQVGQRIAPGGTLAKVAQPTPLKAELKVSETQAKDLLLGQKATVDTRNGLVEGKVIRIDPAVQNGTVTVDVSLDGPLPKGARPDLSVEGIIELDHADDAVFVGRPVQAQSNSEGTLFKLTSGGEAVRVKVRYGRGSVSTIEVLDGLQPGDQVVLSDASQWDGTDRLRIK
ncbi:MAG TPA: HlyD family efflux transporter periplasmic adaptor subunit [Holophagaceae bacterium]|nr:HlyD family efflux transporter periplasmic adaptor subunit [Holophagaceae bacterium]